MERVLIQLLVVSVFSIVMDTCNPNAALSGEMKARSRKINKEQISGLYVQYFPHM